MTFSKSAERIIAFIQSNAFFLKNDFATRDKYLPFAFLCGKARSENDNRSIIQKNVLETNHITSLYSEDLFVFYNEKDIDLMSFEEFVLDISSAIVIIVESYGSACELGSFGLINANLEKLWVITNKDRVTPDSYIEKGPLRKIKKDYPTHVLYEKFDTFEIIELSSNLVSNLSSLDRINLKKTPLEKITATRELLITDAAYVLWFLIDYVRLFGSIAENEFLPVFKKIWYCESVILISSAGNRFDSGKSEKLLQKLPAILSKIGVFVEKKSTRNEKYYVASYDFFKKAERSFFELSSIIFQSSFVSSREAKKELAKIICAKKKEGQDIWKT